MDSSESSSDEAEVKDTANKVEEVGELAKILADVSRDNRELEVVPVFTF